MKKYGKIHRTESLRLQGWDYHSNAAYFVTICTSNRSHYFGKIQDGIMRLSGIGEIAQTCWQEIPQLIEVGKQHRTSCFYDLDKRRPRDG